MRLFKCRRVLNGIFKAVLVVGLFLCIPSPTSAEVRTPTGEMKVLNGIDALIADGFKPLVGKRIALITNPTGVTRDLRSTIDVLHAAATVHLVALFGPEHGVRGDVFAGDKIEDTRDPATGVPVYSLYGQNRKPTRQQLSGVEMIVYDIQDIGARSYTYISTMTLAMEAAAEHHIPFVVLDRPNPLTGNRIEGRPLDKKFASFIGMHPIPYLYGMTCGELARMINGEGWLADGVKCELIVIGMHGWKRDMWFNDTELSWVPTSPHIPHSRVAMFYPATGIMGELRIISEGVGYTQPFELAGAPFITDAKAFSQALNDCHLSGVIFRPMYFRPYYIDRIKGKRCAGVQIHITDRDRVDLTGIQFHIMDVVQQLYPDVELFGHNRDKSFDRACGTDRIRKLFQKHKSADDIIKYWNSDCGSFMRKRAKYLIYESNGRTRSSKRFDSKR